MLQPIRFFVSIYFLRFHYHNMSGNPDEAKIAFIFCMAINKIVYLCSPTIKMYVIKKFGGLLALLERMASDGANRISEAGVPRSVDTVCEWTIPGNASPADAGDAYQPIR